MPEAATPAAPTSAAAPTLAAVHAANNAAEPAKVDAKVDVASPVVDPKAEAKPPEPAKVVEPKVDLTARFAALSKRERAIVEQEKKTKADLAAKEAEFVTKSQKFSDLEQLLATAEKKDYAAILGRLKISYEDLTKWYVQGGKEAVDMQAVASKETKALDEKVSAQQKKIDEMEAAAKKAAEDSARAEAQKQADASRSYVVDKIKGDKRFELLAISGQAAKVYETMVEIVAVDASRADSPEKANALMLEVAESLEAGLVTEFEALSKAEKFAKKVAAAEAAVEAKTEAPVPKSERLKKALATLEGKELSAAAPIVVSNRPKTRAEQIAEIASKMA